MVLRDMAAHLPKTVHFIPAHPVAGTEHSGPDSGFAELFINRWCILTPPPDADPAAVEKLAVFWRAMGANVETMAADHHDLVLAVTSHLPHLIAYTIVGTADELEDVTQAEVLKFSAGGFRDFTRIAASDPTMWRDVFLANKDAVLEMLGAFQEDLSKLTRAIRRATARRCSIISRGRVRSGAGLSVSVRKQPIRTSAASTQICQACGPVIVRTAARSARSAADRWKSRPR
jgi:cyclohexadieny/prephenate dehydrogenase